jgi:hypothetical protein
VSFGYVKDVAGRGFREARNERDYLSERNFECACHGQHHGFHSLRTTAARHARRGTGAVVRSRLFVAGAWLGDDQSRDARGTERQEGNDNCKCKPLHEPIVALEGLDLD